MNEEREQEDKPEAESETETEPQQEPEAEGLSLGELNDAIEKVCNSKASEFEMMGYDRVSGEDVWACVSSKYKKEMPPLHRLINDILTLKSTTFMNWMMINMYKQ